MILLRTLLLILLSVTAHSQTFSTRGTEFWTGFMENRAAIQNPPARFSFFISATRNTSGEISVPATGYSLPFTVQANTVTNIMLPAALFNAIGSETIEEKGILIRSEDSIEVYAMHYRLYFSDASIVLPVTQLGSRYVAIARHDDNATSPSSLLIVASQDNTALEIVPTVLTQNLRPPGRPFTVTLDRGEVYQIQAMGNLSGSSVRSTNAKRFVLYGGAQAAWVGCIAADSHIYDQVLPLEQWGTEYIVIPFRGRKDELEIVASADSTIVYFDCAETIRLDKGEIYTRDFNTAARITATRPIGIAQFSRGFACGASDGGSTGSLGDPTMLVLTPIAQRLRYTRFHASTNMNASAPDHPAFDSHYVALVVPVVDTVGLQLDGVSISSQLRLHPADPRFMQASIPISSGDHLLEAPNGVNAYAYGFGSMDGYTYSLGADTLKYEAGDRLEFDYTAGVHSLAIAACDTMPDGLKLCVGGAFTFRADDNAIGGQWDWDFGDGARASGREVVHTFDSAGEYDVLLTSPGPDCTFRTARKQVTVGDCGRRPEVASRLAVLPNPTKRSLEVRSIVRRRSLVTLELLAADGEPLGTLSQQMLDPGIHVSSIDMGDRPSGVYYLRGSFGDEIVVEKIIRAE